jgi:hypothetical protein
MSGPADPGPRPGGGIGPDQINSGRVNSGRIDPSRNGPDRIAPDRIGPDRIDSGHIDSHRIDPSRVWLRVAAQVWRREPGAVERLAARLLRSAGLARALVVTPSLMVSWLIASLVVIAAGAAATAATGTPFVALLAPPVAACGIALAYGPGIDPAWELSRSMAVGDRLVLLVRALAVFALNALIGVLASLGAGAAQGRRPAAAAGAQAVGSVTYGWLLPMTAICLLALATCVVFGSSTAGLAVGLAGWALAVIGGRAAEGTFAAAVTDPAFGPVYLSIAVCCGAVAVYALRGMRGHR